VTFCTLHLQELEGAEQVLEHAGTEMEQAGRFMLMRDPPVVVEPLDAEARVTEEGPSFSMLKLFWLHVTLKACCIP